MSSRTEHRAHDAHIFDLGARDSRVLRITTTVAMLFIIVFGAGFLYDRLVLAETPKTREALAGSAILVYFFIIACLVRFTTSAITLAGGRIHVREKFGPLTLFRSRPTEDLVRIETRFDETVVNGRPLEGEHRLGVLRLHFAEHKRLTTAIGYPASQLIPLAVALAEACEAHTPHLGRVHLAETMPGAPVITTEPPDHAPQAPPPRAPGFFSRRPRVPRPVAPRRAERKSRLKVKTTPAGPVLTAPPIGIFRSLNGLLGFALLWNTIVTIMIIMVFFPDPNAEFVDSFDPSFLYLPLALFALIGLGLAAYALHMARQRAVFTITPHALQITTKSPFHRSTRLIAPDQILAIRVAPSHFHANGVFINELKISLLGDDTIGLLKHLPDHELLAIVDFLCVELDVTPSTTSRSTADHPFLKRVA